MDLGMEREILVAGRLFDGWFVGDTGDRKTGCGGYLKSTFIKRQLR